MRNLLMIIIVIIVSACGHTYPKTGNPGIDLALTNDALSHETKMNILRKYRGEEPVYENKKPGILDSLTPDRPPAGYARTSATAGGYRPVVDPKKCANCDYEADLAQCQAISAENTQITGNAVAGAAGGALTGALLGAMLNIDAGHTAAMGATAGGLQGVGQELQTSNAMIARCMAGRGYSVLR